MLVPAAEAALQARDKLRLPYLPGDDVTGFSPGAAWQDTKVAMTHPTRREKIAIMTDKEWPRHPAGIFGYQIPGEIKDSRTDEEADARAWIQS